MSRFASSELQEIDLGDGESVKIPVALSYEQVAKLTECPTEGGMSRAMLVECIKEWTIKDDAGNIPELTEANIVRLDIRTVQVITSEITKLLSNDQDKKK